MRRTSSEIWEILAGRRPATLGCDAAADLVPPRGPDDLPSTRRRRAGQADPRRRVGADGDVPTLQRAGSAPDRLAPPGGRLAAGGRHRLPVPPAALAGDRRAAGAAAGRRPGAATRPGRRPTTGGRSRRPMPDGRRDRRRPSAGRTPAVALRPAVPRGRRGWLRGALGWPARAGPRPSLSRRTDRDGLAARDRDQDIQEVMHPWIEFSPTRAPLRAAVTSAAHACARPPPPHRDRRGQGAGRLPPALRRRLVAGPGGRPCSSAWPASLVVVRQPNVYRAIGRDHDRAAAVRRRRSAMHRAATTSASCDHEAIEKYVPNQIALLGAQGAGRARSSSTPASSGGRQPGERPGRPSLSTTSRPAPAARPTNVYEIKLEGNDPARMAKLLETLLRGLPATSARSRERRQDRRRPTQVRRPEPPAHEGRS